MKNRTFSKALAGLMALVLALGLLMALPMTALAKPANEASVQIDVEKYFTTTVAGKWPNVTSFEFTLAPYSYTNGPASLTSPYTNYSKANMPMPGGSAGGTHVFTVANFSTTDVGTQQDRDTLLDPITYDQMGVYTYTIKETIPTPKVSGVEYDTGTYYVNVYVKNVVDQNGEIVMDPATNKPYVTVSDITVFRETNGIATDTTGDNGGADPVTGDEDGKQEIVDPEDPKPDPGPDDDGDDNTPFEYDDGLLVIVKPENAYKVAELKIAKTVKGAMADITKTFSFQVDIKKADGTADTAAYPYTIYDDKDAVVATSTITSGGTIPLKHKQYVKVYAPLGAKVTITETDASAGTYKTSITGIHGAVTPTAVTDATSSRTLGEVTLAGTTNEQSFVNTAEDITPTGVWMNIWPYVLIVALAVAGVGLWLISGKKKGKRTEKNGDGL